MSTTSPYKIIEINVNSAKLIKPKIAGKFYVDIVARNGQGLRTKSVDSSSTLSWNQKFVFSVPKNFIFNEDSTVSFTLFKERRILPDLSVGKATARMKSLFPIPGSCEKDDEDQNCSFKSCKYDLTRHDEELWDEGKDKEGEGEAAAAAASEENFELKAEVGIPILDKGSSKIGTLNVTVVGWEKFELTRLGRSKKTFPISQGSERVGVLATEKTDEEPYLSYVGHVQWRNLAMEFEEFMMEKGIKVKKKKKKKINFLGFRI